MNNVALIGRLTKDPNISNGEKKVARYTLAVNRIKEGTDYINCVTFGKSADFVEKYLKKGIKIAVNGRIQTGSYKNKEGNTVYTTDVVVFEHEFCESKKESKPSNDDGFIDIDNAITEDLPFN